MLKHLIQENIVTQSDIDSERDEVFEIIDQDGMAIKYFPQYQTDMEMVAVAVSQNPLAIKYCPQFQGDKRFDLI